MALGIKLLFPTLVPLFSPFLLCVPGHMCQCPSDSPFVLILPSDMRPRNAGDLPCFALPGAHFVVLLTGLSADGLQRQSHQHLVCDAPEVQSQSWVGESLCSGLTKKQGVRLWGPRFPAAGEVGCSLHPSSQPLSKGKLLRGLRTQPVCSLRG